jgi:hypothetical protein
MSGPERQSDGLPEEAESLLDGWPVPGRSALEWEDLANATVSRIRETRIGSTDDNLLDPPLPKADGEGELSEKPVEREMPPDEPRLLAIAKAAVLDAASEEAKDIARAGLKAAEHSKQSRPPAPPTRVAGHVHRGTPSGAASLQGHLPPSSTRPVQAVHAAQARSELPAGSKRGGEKASPGVMLAGAMLALAAGVALYVAVHRGGPTAVAVATSQESAQAPAAAGPQPTATTARAEEPAAEPHMLALDDLKPSEAPAKVPEAAKVVVPTAGSSMSLVLRSKNAAPAAPAPKKVELAEAEPQQQAVAMNEGAASAAGSKQSSDDSAKQALPNHPSQGAILGAVGSVMLGARSCLAGQDEGSKVQVTFGSDGHVKAISVVSGPAAGTPAEGCLRSALMGARVSPFSEPEYAASITVRPP